MPTNGQTLQTKYRISPSTTAVCVLFRCRPQPFAAVPRLLAVVSPCTAAHSAASSAVHCSVAREYIRGKYCGCQHYRHPSRPGDSFGTVAAGDGRREVHHDMVPAPVQTRAGPFIVHAAAPARAGCGSAARGSAARGLAGRTQDAPGVHAVCAVSGMHQPMAVNRGQLCKNALGWRLGC